MQEASTYVAREAHKDAIDVSLAEAGANREVRHSGTIGGDLLAVAQLVRRLRRKGAHSAVRLRRGPLRLQV